MRKKSELHRQILWDKDSKSWLRFNQIDDRFTVERARPSDEKDPAVLGFWESLPTHQWPDTGYWVLFDPGLEIPYQYKLTDYSRQLWRRHELPEDDGRYTPVYEKWSTGFKWFIPSQTDHFDQPGEPIRLPGIGLTPPPPYHSSPRPKPSGTVNHIYWDVNTKRYLKFEITDDGNLVYYQTRPDPDRPHDLDAWDEGAKLFSNSEKTVWDGQHYATFVWREKQLYRQSIQDSSIAVYDLASSQWKKVEGLPPRKTKMHKKEKEISPADLKSSPPELKDIVWEKLQVWPVKGFPIRKKDRDTYSAHSCARICLHTLVHRTQSRRDCAAALWQLIHGGTKPLPPGWTLSEQGAEATQRLQRDYLSLEMIYFPKEQMSARNWNLKLRLQMAEEFGRITEQPIGNVIPKPVSEWKDPVDLPLAQTAKTLSSLASGAGLILNTTGLSLLEQAVMEMDAESDDLSDRGKRLYQYLSPEITVSHSNVWRAIHLPRLKAKLQAAHWQMTDPTPAAFESAPSPFDEEKFKAQLVEWYGECDHHPDSNTPLFKKQLKTLSEHYDQLAPGQVLNFNLFLDEKKDEKKSTARARPFLSTSTKDSLERILFTLMQTKKVDKEKQQAIFTTIAHEFQALYHFQTCGVGVANALTPILSDLTISPGFIGKMASIRRSVLYQKELFQYMKNPRGYVGLPEEKHIILKGWETHLGIMFAQWAQIHYLDIPGTERESKTIDPHVYNQDIPEDMPESKSKPKSAEPQVHNIEAENILFYNPPADLFAYVGWRFKSTYRDSLAQLVKDLKDNLPKPTKPALSEQQIQEVKDCLKELLQSEVLTISEVLDARIPEAIIYQAGFFARLPSYVLKYLLKKGILAPKFSADQKDTKMGDTPLISAVRSRDLEGVRRLAPKMGIDHIHHINGKDETALTLALSHEYVEIVHFLSTLPLIGMHPKELEHLRHKIRLLIKWECIPFIRLILWENKINISELIEMESSALVILAVVATQIRSQKLLQTILRAGINGVTILMKLASKGEDVESIRFCLAAGISKKDGADALTIAVEEKLQKAVALLVEAKADTESVLTDFVTRKKDLSNPQLLQLLLEAKADASQVLNQQKEISFINFLLQSIITLLKDKKPIHRSIATSEACFMAAININHPDMVEALLKAGLSLDGVDAHRLLLEVALKGWEPCMQSLLEAKILIDARNDKGNSALMTACDIDTLDAADMLLRARASHQAKNRSGFDALTIAMQAGNLGMVRLLVDAKADISTIVWNPSEKAFLGEMRCLLSSRSEVQPEKLSSSLQRALRLATNDGDEQLVRLLTTKHVNLEEEDDDHSTALMIACQTGRETIVTTLLEAGALRHDDAFRIATEFGRTDVVEVLLEHINARTLTTGDFLLSLAIRTERHPIFRMLLKAGIQIEDGATLLFDLVENRWRKSIPLLLKANVSINAHDTQGNSALIWTVKEKNCVKTMVKFLIRNRIDVNAANAEGWTALMFACRKGRLDVVKVLLTAGALHNMVNRKGLNAQMIAAQYKRRSIVRVLSEAEDKASAEAPKPEGLTGPKFFRHLAALNEPSRSKQKTAEAEWRQLSAHL